ncbi:type III glutamate--ammonia ligase [Mesorhizobium sp. SARCC-RB16n]|uniref:type III glutamate--ammonia ligase n=1 Tax=Mesorhizobium sp. SARCC-RB16n TaxID=2116687 RepID=UPI00122F7881|nr:type III glutamate--ammonia ligase [Mesorhizobium sp. SARCC-RB16n]KAA3451425.1 type III glutamate--ammonia ligase [Mesorhizobium sp. SARCC-RB16n]
MHFPNPWTGALSPGCLSTPKELDTAGAQAFLEQAGVRYVLAQFVDLHGVAKSKAVPVQHLDAILTEGAAFASSGLCGLGLLPHEAEFMVVCELDTLMVTPWAPGYARMTGVGAVKGTPHPIDTRNVLKKQVARLAQRGWTLNTGLEPEFMLLRREPDGKLSPFDGTDTLTKPAYDYRGLMRGRMFLERVTECLQAVGIDVYQIDHEDANCQYEINFKYADALKTADQIIFFRMAASEIAHDLGAICSFMPKPRSNSTGSGMHIHCSIADADERNLFHDDADPNGMGLSKLAYHFLGGVLAHAKGLTALLAPTVNSYKRLVVGGTVSGTTWAPACIAYGDNNRTAMVRIPYGRLEIRTGDSSMNPYLATAALIAAGLDGIEKKIEPGAPRNVNFNGLTLEAIKEMSIDLLPQTLTEALDAVEADQLFAGTLGTPVIEQFLTLKRSEWLEYHRHVSDWEIERYLNFF